MHTHLILAYQPPCLPTNCTYNQYFILPTIERKKERKKERKRETLFWCRILYAINCFFCFSFLQVIVVIYLNSNV